MYTIKTKHDHINKTGIYAVSRPVKSYNDVRHEVESMITWFDETDGSFSGAYKTAMAISHCQVCDDPYAFFVVAKQFVNSLSLEEEKNLNKKNYYFPARAIFNAEILETPEKVERDIPERKIVKDKEGKVSEKVTVTKGLVKNLIAVPEACMSFPNRSKRDTERYYRIKVRYQIKGIFGLKTVTEWVEGLKAHMFQHEIDHAQGKNMYFHK
jgi:hypothetical protein